VLVAVIVVLLGTGTYKVIKGTISHQLQKSRETIAADKATIKTLGDNLTQANKDKIKAEKEVKQIRQDETDFKAKEAAKTAKAYAERDAALAKLKAMPSDELAGNMSAYIIPEFFTAHADNTFSTTRAGAENTQGIFLDWKARGEKIGNLEAAAKKDADSDAEAEKLRKDVDEKQAKAQAVKDAAIDKTTRDLAKNIKLLERQRFWTWVKAGVPAVALGVVIGFLVHK
jgi:hypothetical protein